ncbi:MAG: type II CRISPR-associated endonuclease Cas1 [Thermoguttaceae bacterium]|nr:type II CRISPR-associated endonuclease Cas1 [Thermoguttaceae bacterium]
MSNNRILDFSLTPVKLRVRDKQLKVYDENVVRDSVPIEDIACVVLAHPQLTVSLGLMKELFAENVPIVVCDETSIPTGLCLPLYGHYAGARRVQLQAEAYSERPLMKRLWKQIVKHKIKNQARLLQLLFQDDCGLLGYYQTVKSGDSDNREGAASKRYWAKLFDGENFRRDYNGSDSINAALNYGYSLLRAIVARAIVSVGLCPTLGICHHNKYNGYALADDLIEPFRPVVDCCVYGLLGEDALDNGLIPEVKVRIIRQITSRYHIDGERVNLFETVLKAAESLVWVLKRESNEISFPTQMPFEPVDSANIQLKKPAEPKKKKEPRAKKKPPF